MKRPALIVIDMLNDFLDNWPAPGRQQLVQSLNDLVSFMRSSNYPIVWVRQEFEPDLRDAFRSLRARGTRITIKGTAGSQIISDLAVAPTDPIIIKKRYSAFHGTHLEEVLHQLHPDVLILAGINTHACVRVTAIDAYQRDWEVFLAADCIDSYDREHHDISLRYMKGEIASVLTNQEIRVALSVLS